MSLGPRLTTPRPFPVTSDGVARRARNVVVARCIASALPALAVRMSVDFATLSGRTSALEARVAALAHRDRVARGA